MGNYVFEKVDRDWKARPMMKRVWGWIKVCRWSKEESLALFDVSVRYPVVSPVFYGVRIFPGCWIGMYWTK